MLDAPMSREPPTTPWTTGTPEARFLTCTVSPSLAKNPRAWATATSALAKLVTLVGSPRLMVVVAPLVPPAAVLDPLLHEARSAEVTVRAARQASQDKRRMKSHLIRVFGIPTVSLRRRFAPPDEAAFHPLQERSENHPEQGEDHDGHEHACGLK